MTNSHILITGGTGFIGKSLLRRLSKSFEVRVASRQSTSLELELPTIITGDINRLTDWRKALDGITTVVHLAAYAHVIQPSELNLSLLNEVNVTGTENLIRQCIDAGVNHFVFMSSVGAMSSLSDVLLTEKSSCHPTTPYGISKLDAERRLIRLSHGSNMAWTIIRPPLVYGSGNPGNMARLQALVRRQIPLPLASIQNQRSFLYVENLVDVIINCIINTNSHNQTFLVSDGQNLSTPGLIYKISQCLGTTCQLFPLPVFLLKIAGYCGDGVSFFMRHPLSVNSDVITKLTGSLTVDNSKICKLLSWHPPYTIDEGLTRTLQYS